MINDEIVTRFVELQNDLGAIAAEVYESSPEILQRLATATTAVSKRVDRLAEDLRKEARLRRRLELSEV